MDWIAFGSMASAVGSVAIAVTAILAYRQLKELTRTRWVEAVTRVFDMLINPATSAARRYVRTNALPAPGHVSPEEFDKMYLVWVSFDNLGVMIAHDMLPPQLPMEMFHASIIECWEKLLPHILHERKQRGDRYQIFFEDLYCRSLEYRLQHRSRDDNPLGLRRTTRQP